MQFIAKYMKRQLAAKALGIALEKRPMHELKAMLADNEKANNQYLVSLRAARMGTTEAEAKPEVEKAKKAKKAKKATVKKTVDNENLAEAYKEHLTNSQESLEKAA
jgi:hypothetical protein